LASVFKNSDPKGTAPRHQSPLQSEAATLWIRPFWITHAEAFLFCNGAGWGVSCWSLGYSLLGLEAASD